MRENELYQTKRPDNEVNQFGVSKRFVNILRILNDIKHLEVQLNKTE